MSVDKDLAVLLRRETESMEYLLAILEQETKALLASDIDSIEKIVSVKNQALAAQNTATQARQKISESSSFENSDEGLRQLIDSCGDREELTSIYTQLSSLSQQCHTINRSNGHLILKKQHQANGALNVLRQTDDSTPTYSGRGKQMGGPSSRSLGKA